jgi:hypothetical protein
MSTGPTILERAYELARSGECSTLQMIKRRLKAEGFIAIDAHLYGRTLQDELRRLCHAALGLPPKSPGRKAGRPRASAAPARELHKD